MAGISDLLAKGGAGGVREALAAQRAARRDRLDANVQAAGSGLSGWERGLAQFGAGLGGGIAGEVFKEPDSPEVEAARAQASIVEAIQQIEAPVGTAAHAAEAGKIANAAGRTDLGLQFAERAAVLGANEAKLAKETEAAEVAAESEAFGKLPEAMRLSVTANEPERLQRLLGLTPSQAKAVSDDARKTLNTLQAKQQKALDELNAVPTTKSSSEDIKQTEGLLLNSGIGGHSFEAWTGRDNPERATNFARLMDQQATAEIDKAAQKGTGERLTKAQVYNEIMEELSAQGGVEGWGTEDVTGIDLEKLSTIFKERSKAAPKSNAQSGTPTRRRVIVSP